MLSILTLFILTRYPFEPIQLTLISSLTIGIPSFFLALEPNHTRVKGNFLLNVLGNALPGALCVVISIIYVNILSYIFHFNADTMSTMCVLLTGANGLIILYRVCSPFTKKRFILFSSLTSIFILCILLLPNLFSLVPLHWISTLFTLLGIIVLPFIMNFLFRIGKKVKLKERIEQIGQ